jgi:hypothetical protein
MNVPVQREENGRFLPGFTPNPSGRPKGAGAIRELARQYLPAALAKIGALIESNDPRVALAASQEILNRVFGKPVQSVEADVRRLDMTKLYHDALKMVNGVASDHEQTPAAIEDATPEGEPPIVDLTPAPDHEPAAIDAAHDADTAW